VFTARYALSPYIKHISFIFKGLITKPVVPGIEASNVKLQSQTLVGAAKHRRLVTSEAKYFFKSYSITGVNRALGFQESEALSFQENRHMKVIWLSALRTGRLYSPENIPGTHFISGSVDPRTTLQPEELCQWQIPTIPSEIEPATFQFVAQCLNQLHHRVPLKCFRSDKTRLNTNVLKSNVVAAAEINYTPKHIKQSDKLVHNTHIKLKYNALQPYGPLTEMKSLNMAYQHWWRAYGAVTLKESEI
jgi:hypothetical protein